MEMVAGFTPAKAGIGAALLAAVNPKNLLLIAAGMAALAESELTGAAEVLGLLVYTIIASAGVLIPLGAYLVLGERARPYLEGTRAFLIRNYAIILSLLCLVIGAKLISMALGELL
jgi:hypothetical protein